LLQNGRSFQPTYFAQFACSVDHIEIHLLQFLDEVGQFRRSQPGVPHLDAVFGNRQPETIAVPGRYKLENVLVFSKLHWTFLLDLLVAVYRKPFKTRDGTPYAPSGPDHDFDAIKGLSDVVAPEASTGQARGDFIRLTPHARLVGY
jgi:hypothetical protein